MQILAYVEDIFVTAKIRELARAADRDVRFIRDRGTDKRLSATVPELVLLDLTAETLRPMELIQQIKETPEWASCRVVAYAPHARAELMEEANRLGADIVLPKSGFTQKLAEILQGAVL
jgi:DNA-binding NarL/FixJ family response regulator